MSNEEKTPRQTDVPGTERKKIAKLEELMEGLDDANKAKTRASNKRKEAEQRCIDYMREKEIPEYTSLDLGMTLTVEDVTHAKLAAYKPPDEKGDKKPRLAEA